ncbi:MAG: hypothetical protein P1U36_10275 [Legionellaceae bacterium]|nr:hypothetical protein [Legionellaceae bacterium]
MRITIHQMISTCTLILMLNVSAAHACQSNTDCSQWSETNCACGVRATCIGLTAQNKTGYCQCYGAQGNCKADTVKDVTNPYVAPGRRVAPRAAPIRRGIRR